MTSDLDKLEAVATELMQAFSVTIPPVPVETMLQQPPPGMWETLNVSQLTGSFLSIKDKYSPRMSLARMLARHVINSGWGQQRGLDTLVGENDDLLRAFTRMILMPSEMLRAQSPGSRNPVAISLYFEVPESEAEKRLTEWAG